MHFKILYQILSFSQMVPYSFLFYTLMTIISSRSKVGLQNSLNTLYSFSSSWMLDIISKKTEKDQNYDISRTREEKLRRLISHRETYQ